MHRIYYRAFANQSFFHAIVTSQANEMLLFNRQLTAKEACQAGLVTEVIPGGNFWNEVTKRVEGVVDCPLKVSITKAFFRV